MHFVDDKFLLLSRGGRTGRGRSASVEIGPDRAQYAPASRPSCDPAQQPARPVPARVSSAIRGALRRPQGSR
jgi:hypothetical protein